MPCTIVPDARPDAFIVTYVGDLQYDDLLIQKRLGVYEGRRVWLMVDLSQMNNRLPPNYMQGILKSFVTDAGVLYISGYVPSAPLRVLSDMVVNITRQRHKISLHNSYEAAYTQLHQAMDAAGLPKEASLSS